MVGGRRQQRRERCDGNIYDPEIDVLGSLERVRRTLEMGVQWAIGEEGRNFIKVPRRYSTFNSTGG